MRFKISGDPNAQCALKSGMEVFSLVFLPERVCRGCLFRGIGRYIFVEFKIQLFSAIKIP